jgi:GNAT superfamily N-acetyltransferase
MTVELRRLTTDDLETATRILDGAYGPGPGRVARLLRYLSIEPDGWLLALADGTPAGMGGALDFGAFAYVGLVGVVPEAQRLGIGRALMERLLAWLGEIGCPCVLLDASEAGEPLYRRLGFVVSDEVHVYAGVTPSKVSRKASSPGARIAPAVEADLDAIVALDRRITGGNRRKLIEAYMVDFARRAFVARGASGEVSGFVVAQSASIGPWIAEDAETAERLLDEALCVSFDDAVTVYAPATNVEAPAILIRRRFDRVRAVAHMRLGDEPARRRDRIFGQASLAAG